MTRLKITGLIVGAVTVCGLAAILVFSNRTPDSSPVAAGGKEPAHSAPAGGAAGNLSASADKTMVAAAAAGDTGADTSGPKTGPETDPKTDPEELDRELHQQVVVARLKELFGGNIAHPRIQLQAIEKLSRYLKQAYPDNWQDQVLDYLTAAFPDHAEELYDNYLKFTEFKQLIKDNQAYLLSMSPEQQKEYLWATRKQFFGEKAEVIWEMELKAERLSQSLEELNLREEARFDEKLKYYLTELDAIYGNQAETYRKVRQQEMMDQFLAVDSVQKDLRQMTPAERQEDLDRFRETMGLDEAARQRWAELDRARDQRWARGREYMRERKRVLRESGGPDRETRLDQLRREYFGTDAGLIKQEERSGLFRFERERVYGKN